MANFAYVHAELRRYKEASLLYNHCLKSVRRESHPILRSLASLADCVYGKNGRHIEAISILKQCLAKQKSILGDNHADTLKTMMRLVANYGKNQEELDLACELCQQCLSKRAKGSQEN